MASCTSATPRRSASPTASPSLGGLYNLRFDDTNPLAEEIHYVEASAATSAGSASTGVDREYFASDYFEQLLRMGRARVHRRPAKPTSTSLTPEEIKEYRGASAIPGRESPYRSRSVEENLDLFRRMRAGEFPDGSLHAAGQDRHGVAQHEPARPDHVPHPARRPPPHRATSGASTRCTTGRTARATPSRAITHSLCSLEYEIHRPLYDWFLDQLALPQRPRADRVRAAEPHATPCMSKRLLLQLVAGWTSCTGWDDPAPAHAPRAAPRAATRASAIREFCSFIGSRAPDSRHGVELLESFVRTELNRTALPPHGGAAPAAARADELAGGAGGRTVEWFELGNNPENPDDGVRVVPFTGELFIEGEDFAEVPPPKFFRPARAGREVRLRSAYLVQVHRRAQGRVGPCPRGASPPTTRRRRAAVPPTAAR